MIRALLVALLIIAPAARTAAGAHPAISAAADIKITRDGRVTITLTHDSLAFALNEQPAKIADEPMLALLAGPREDLAAAFADARERLELGLRVIADGARVPMTVTETPDPDAALRWGAEHPTLPLPVRLDFVVVGTIPANAKRVSISFPSAIGDAIVMLDRPGVEPLIMPLAAGEATPELPPMTGPPPAPGPSPTPAPASQPVDDRPGLLAVAWRFVAFGFNHIIPGGYDHGLFVLGLFLLTPDPRRILWPITTFTLAHTTTVFLTAVHLVRSPPPSIVEPAIAATIAFVAIENILSRKGRIHPWRPALAFAFGLIHGMGFAGELSSVPMPTGQLVTAVLAFNVGVEGGHVAILAGAFATLGWARRRAWYRSRVLIPLSLAIAAISACWFLQRVGLA